MWKFLVIVVFVFNIGIVLGLFEGDICEDIDNISHNESLGVCTHIHNCTTAKEALLLKRKLPKICTFKGDLPIVCCFDPKVKEIKPTYLSIDSNDPNQVKMTEDNCPPIPEKYVKDPQEPDRYSDVLTTNKTGQIAWDKCIEYQQNLIFPCVINKQTNKHERLHRCEKLRRYKRAGLGTNGKDAYLYEFAHMALLGYGALELNEWLCGGTIISEKFILTAGHCVYSAKLGNVTRVATGFLRRSDIPKSANIYNVTNIVPHPDYKAPSKYNDIALLEVQGMHLDEFQVPACLHAGDYAFNTDLVEATGWGALWYRGDRPDVLQKMILKAFTADACKKKFPANRLLKHGYDDTTQMCYGDPFYNTDTCDGDSGGPLQMAHSSMHCMHLVVGVTSFGTHCGLVNQPAVYTRVKYYVPWIESIVWPSQRPKGLAK